MRRLRSRQRSHHETPELPVTPSAGSGGAAATPAPAGVRFLWGSVEEQMDLEGLTVEAIYRMLREPYRIAPAVRAVVNGREVTADHTLRCGDVVEFIRPAGEKGAAA